MPPPPPPLSARCAGPLTRALLGGPPLAAFAVWGTAQVSGLSGELGGHVPAVAWLASFVLLWWVPLAWLERPIRVPPERRAGLAGLAVTVQVPVYNEDPATLRECLRSVLRQSRRVERVRVVDDGSADPAAYDRVRRDFEEAAAALGVETTWDRTANRGKRHAQLHALSGDDADVFVTLDSDSVLDRHAVREGLAPFADPRVRSVAGQVLVLNRAATPLTRLTCLLYLPLTRGVRSAQSVLRRVTANSGALAFYRADVVRRCAGAYAHERFAGRPMQMNDDSMLTFYAMLGGDTVQQPSALVFTLVPERVGHHVAQQLRWLRGTTVRHLWWLRYLPVRGFVFWATVAEYLHLALALAVPVALAADPAWRPHLGEIGLTALRVGVAMSYLTALRLFTVRRSDEPAASRLLLFLAAPAAALWRLAVLRPLHLYALLTCRRVGRWGTRAGVEVTIAS
ncbi:glycosyltransferase family 2 protein [Spongiactinospora sp. TRM90649]|uniref:glycosyltransferase family 2 protein n=1 Tax=Spongiactinospora sp. TRM90649 TaxID=3031114 RepID=UPI0023F939C0|nr:glycosyltransferase family 2 protein [Spongiactinospora sp. TRM90649]MDF5751824.1 glycosyltransferase family 2 protein [Spongiactinospora sp. TRM90649]